MPELHAPVRLCARQRVLAALALVLAVQGPGIARASEVPDGSAPDLTELESAASSAETLLALIRRGIEYNSAGDLAAADTIWSRIHREYPDHPAAPVFEVKTLYLRKFADFQNDSFDAAIQERCERAIALSERRLTRTPNDARAHFYLGQALFQLTLLEGFRGHYFSAGVYGERAREHLERAIELEPDFVDAKLPLGMYYYYASLAPGFIKWLSWLWFIPTGERETGIALVEEVSNDGDWFRVEASISRQRIQHYLDQRPDLALPTVVELHDRYPQNSYVHFEVVELLMSLGDYPAAARTALELERADGHQFGDAQRRALARVWRARAELYQGHVGQAAEILETFDGDRERLTAWGQNWLLLTHGHILDLRGHREQAISYYEEVIDRTDRWNSSRAVKLASAALEEPFRLEEQPAVASE